MTEPPLANLTFNSASRKSAETIIGLLDRNHGLLAMNLVGEMLRSSFRHVHGVRERRQIIQLLGIRLDSEEREVLEPKIATLGKEWELQFNLGRIGLTAGALRFDMEEFANLLSLNPEAPFTGGGATGADQRGLRIPITHIIRLLFRQRETLVRYSNPISSSGMYVSLGHYLKTLTVDVRVRQACLLLLRPITSLMAESFAGNLPSRAQVMVSAARVHNLQPHLLAAIILAEQRDQSSNEDMAEYLAANSVIRANTSVGLGQIRITGVKHFDLFADLLSQGTRERLTQKEIVSLLISDEFNIFATARYIRVLADLLATRSAHSFPRTLAAFPDLVLGDYSKNSSEWPEDNIRALASKYNSTPTGDQPIKDWADFVRAAHEDVMKSGLLGPCPLRTRRWDKASNKFL